MQTALLFARSDVLRRTAAAGTPLPQKIPIRSREALRWATIGGARALRMEHRIGSLTPGKKADIVLLRSDDLNLTPVHDPLLSVIEQAHPGNVDTVIVDGEIRKSAGQLWLNADVLRARRRRWETRVPALLASTNPQPGWSTKVGLAKRVHF
jgi:5-methylthioadenosine/S-adenosylhomocysteine deaminase